MKTKRVKALRMYGTKYAHPDNRGIITPIYNGKIPGLSQVPVYILPADTDSHERMVEQGAHAIYLEDGNKVAWKQTPSHFKRFYLAFARAALASWGITAPKKGTQ